MTDGSDFGAAAIVRGAAVETLVAGHSTLHLLLDSSATNGALSAHRVHLRDGADGAGPHRHSRSSEMFYVLDGTIELLFGQRTWTATKGDLAVVPPGTDHAFAAPPGGHADLLVVITPGVERFSFFRQVVRIIKGLAGPTTLQGTEEQYDTHAADSSVWRRRTTASKGALI